MKRSPSLQKEAVLFSRYLTRRLPTVENIALYERSVPAAATDYTYIAATQHPHLLPYLDAYDALFRPSSHLRQRLYLMFSILEASPEYTELFLPQQRSLWYLPVVAAYSMRGIYRLAIGAIVVKVHDW